MSKFRTLSGVVLAATLLVAGTGCAYLEARDNLNKGIAAYKSADYPTAIERFKAAIELDPEWIDPQLYLATTYMGQWIPGAQSPENLQFAEQAKSEFRKVLEMDPNHENALASLAAIAYNEGTSLPLEEKKVKFAEAAEWQHKRLAVNPDAGDSYYSLGVMAYAQTLPVWIETRAGLGMNLEAPGPLPDEEVRTEFRQSHGALLDEGLMNLNEALRVDPENADAMIYVNLIIRQQADMVDTEEAYAAQIAEADDWLQKSLDTRKIKADREAKAASSGITQE